MKSIVRAAATLAFAASAFAAPIAAQASVNPIYYDPSTGMCFEIVPGPNGTVSAVPVLCPWEIPTFPP